MTWLYPILITALVGLIIWLIQQLISSKVNERLLKKENSELKEKYSKLERENSTLQKALSKYTQQNLILSKYTFDESYGFQRLKSNNDPHCNKCLIEKTLESPLRVQHGNSWYCNICNASYYPHNRNLPRTAV